MAKKTKTQKTPKGKDIPVPKRKDVFKDLKKVAKPGSSSDRGSQKK